MCDLQFLCLCVSVREFVCFQLIYQAPVGSSSVRLYDVKTCETSA